MDHKMTTNTQTITELRIEVLQRISAYKATRRPAQNKTFSKRIVLGAQTDILPLTCSESGIVYALMLPAVAGKGLEFNSPFSSYKNCRMMAQEGFSYLSKLDSQILSGILLILADNYSLFRFAPTDSGVQKNALLRTVDRELLIDAIILIENWANTTSCMYWPKLSIILDAHTAELGLSARMREWLKLVVESIYTPDTSPEESITVKKTPTVSKAKKELVSVRKDFRDWKREAKQDILLLATENKISQKLKTYLLAVLTEDNIAAADSGTIDLMAQKLTQLGDTVASELADQITYFHSKLAVSTTDWDEPESQPLFSSQPVGSSLSEQTDKPEDKESEPKAQVETLSLPTESPESPAEAQVAEAKPLSFIEKLRLKKQAEAAKNTSKPTKSELPDAPF
jgi:hypothetical protein